MAKKSRQRQLQNRHARIAAAAAARERARRRRWLVAITTGLAIALVVVIALLITGDDGDDAVVAGDESAATSTTAAPVDANGDGIPDSTDTTAAAGSAAGLPCVEMAEAPPAGAPDVPVQVGPPPTSLITEDLQEGDGAEVKVTDTVTVNYIGVACSSGKVFDDSYSRGQPATFALNQVIRGWQDGIPGMKVGGKRLLGIPADQAYGTTGSPPDILPDEALWFVVEVLDAQSAAAG